MNTVHQQHKLPELPLDATEIVAVTLQHNRRVLLFGPMGAGKSTLAAKLANTLCELEQDCYCLNADPGSPAFGVPGSVSLAAWQNQRWDVIDCAALCTLNAGRFRLPLVSAVRHLAHQIPDGLALIDAPGVVRGIAARELLHGLVEAAAIDVVLALSVQNQPPPLLEELRSLTADVFVLPAASSARRPGKRMRARQRTEQWDQLLETARLRKLDLSSLNIVGTPPLPAEPSAWKGKQIALLGADRTLAMGEVQQIDADVLTVLLSAESNGADTLLIRDAVRSVNGYLETATPYASERFEYLPPNDILPTAYVDTGPRIVGSLGAVDLALVNGVFGDPLLHARMRHQRRSLLFDLGSGDRLPARIAHQVTDVFVSHAHMDHIGGFLWLLRSRIGDYPACRLFGPPGLARHIAGFLQGILWDRVENYAPSFDVMELHDDRVCCFRLTAGQGAERLYDQKPRLDDTVLTEAGFRVRGISLDHQGTTVIAYAFEAKQQLNIRKDRLKAREFEAGPWLKELKQHIQANNLAAMIQLPDGSVDRAGALADELVQITPGKKLVYATDFADTDDNHGKLVHLARHAHTFFCECSFMEADREHARRNGHLTTRACGEIATEAGVSRLLPFHFSRRYQHRTDELYDELSEYCSHVCLPRSIAVFEASSAIDQVVDID
jgi:ribonuclease BN (tRNA processing enzyme)/polynucleotide 5'-kinase involved in rRNA processing